MTAGAASIQVTGHRMQGQVVDAERERGSCPRPARLAGTAFANQRNRSSLHVLFSAARCRRVGAENSKGARYEVGIPAVRTACGQRERGEDFIVSYSSSYRPGDRASIREPYLV